MGEPAVGTLDLGPDTQLPGPSSSSATPSRWSDRVSTPVIAKLELDLEVLALEKSDHPLQCVSRRRRHPELIALNRGLHLLEALVLHRLHNALGDVLRDALSESDGAAYTLPGCLLDVTHLEVLHRHAALDHLRLQHIHQRVHSVFIIRAQPNLGLGPVERHLAVGPLEVVALGDLLEGLIDGIIDLLE